MSAVITGEASSLKLRHVRNASQQKMKARVVMQIQKRDLFLMGNLSSPAFTLFTEHDEVGRREAPSLVTMVQVGVPGLHNWTRLNQAARCGEKAAFQKPVWHHSVSPFKPLNIPKCLQF